MEKLKCRLWIWPFLMRVREFWQVLAERSCEMGWGEGRDRLHFCWEMPPSATFRAETHSKTHTQRTSTEMIPDKETKTGEETICQKLSPVSGRKIKDENIVLSASLSEEIVFLLLGYTRKHKFCMSSAVGCMRMKMWGPSPWSSALHLLREQPPHRTGRKARERAALRSLVAQGGGLCPVRGRGWAPFTRPIARQPLFSSCTSFLLGEVLFSSCAVPTFAICVLPPLTTPH